MTRTITVAAHKADRRVYKIQKYDNRAAWNVVDGVAPNGVSATRYLRRTAPDISQLSPLANFLFANCPDYIAGNFPAFDHSHRVRCYNGKSQAHELRERAAIPDSFGRYWANGSSYCDAEAALQIVDSIISDFDLEKKQARIEDWRFSIIGIHQSDEDYWNQEAKKILAVGIVRVEIGSNVFQV